MELLPVCDIVFCFFAEVHFSPQLPQYCTAICFSCCLAAAPSILYSFEMLLDREALHSGCCLIELLLVILLLLFTTYVAVACCCCSLSLPLAVYVYCCFRQSRDVYCCCRRGCLPHCRTENCYLRSFAVSLLLVVTLLQDVVSCWPR